MQFVYISLYRSSTDEYELDRNQNTLILQANPLQNDSTNWLMVAAAVSE
jgi:hypothetical protein